MLRVYAPKAIGGPAFELLLKFWQVHPSWDFMEVAAKRIAWAATLSHDLITPDLFGAFVTYHQAHTWFTDVRALGIALIGWAEPEKIPDTAFPVILSSVAAVNHPSNPSQTDVLRVLEAYDVARLPIDLWRQLFREWLPHQNAAVLLAIAAILQKTDTMTWQQTIPWDPAAIEDLIECLSHESTRVRTAGAVLLERAAQESSTRRHFTDDLKRKLYLCSSAGPGRSRDFIDTLRRTMKILGV